MKKRLLSALLALCLVVGMVPTTLLTAHAATAVKVTGVSVSGLPAAPVANEEVDLSSISVSVDEYKEGTAAATSGAHGSVELTHTATVTGAEKRTDGKYYWKAGQVATITISVKAYSTDADYSASVGMTSVKGTEINDWNISKSGSTITAKYDLNGKEGIQTSATKESDGSTTPADTIAYLDAAQITGSYVDSTYPNGTKIGPVGSSTGITLNVVKGQKATLYLSSLDENQNKGGSISVVSNSVPGDLFTASGSNTITVTGKIGGKSGTFLVQTAKAGNCDVKQFSITVNVLEPAGTFVLKSPVTSVELSDDTRVLTATLTDSTGTNPVDFSAGTVSFEVDDPNILTVEDTTGTITPIGPGTATITATYKDGSGNALATSQVKVQVVRDKVVIPVAQAKDYTYMSGDTVFAWTTQPDTARVTVLLNGVQITDNDLSNLNFAPAGNNTVTVSLTEPDKDQWADGTVADKIFTWRVDPKRLNSTTISAVFEGDAANSGTFTYSGKPFTVNSTLTGQDLGLKVSDSIATAVNSGVLQLGVDYTISAHYNNVYAGKDTASVTIVGKGNYAGTQTYSFTIEQNASAELTIPATMTKPAGSSFDLKSIVTQNSIPNFDPSKLTGTGFVWALADGDKTKATLKDSTLKLNSNLGADATVTVSMTYTGTYDANGDNYPEYRLVTGASGAQVVITVATKIQSVTIPTGVTGLVYNGKEQVGVPDGALYNLGSGANPPLDHPNEVDTGKSTDAGKYYTTVTLDQSKAPAGTVLAWADGSTDDKAIAWEIAKATPKVTVSFSPMLTAGETLADADLSVLTAVGVNGANLSGGGAAAWDAAAGTYIVKGASYGWTWTPTASSATETNYNKVTGSAVLLGNTTGTSGSDQTPEQENPNQDITTSTVTNPDGSTTTITNNKKTGVVTHVTTASNGTSSELTYTKGALTAASATSTAANAVAYVPMTGVSWGSVITINGAARVDAGLPAEGLNGMWVVLPTGTVSLGLRNQAASFTDVRTNEWFYKAVMLASSRNLIQGIGSNSYGPAGTLNFGQVWSMLARYTGDVTLAQSTGNNWYVQPQNWAYRNNISSGVSYNANATREDVALMMYRTYALENGTPTNVNTSYLSSMSDYGSVSSAARTAVAWAIQNGIIQGYPNGTFQPHNSIRRDEAAQMMARFVYVMEGVNVPSDFMS